MITFSTWLTERAVQIPTWGFQPNQQGFSPEAFQKGANIKQVSQLKPGQDILAAVSQLNDAIQIIKSSLGQSPFEKGQQDHALLSIQNAHKLLQGTSEAGTLEPLMTNWKNLSPANKLNGIENIALPRIKNLTTVKS
jgi:hypothetical protein